MDSVRIPRETDQPDSDRYLFIQVIKRGPLVGLSTLSGVWYSSIIINSLISDIPVKHAMFLC